MAGEEASGGAMKFVRSLGRLSVGIRHRKLPRISLLWAFIACALIYNPVAILSLGKEIWTIVNVITIGLFGSHFWARKSALYHDWEETGK